MTGFAISLVNLDLYWSLLGVELLSFRVFNYLLAASCESAKHKIKSSAENFNDPTKINNSMII